MTPALALERITCTFAAREDRNKRYTAVKDTTLVVAEGEFVSVVGPTGCGKSTLLNVAAGFLGASAGRGEVKGQTLSRHKHCSRDPFLAHALSALCHTPVTFVGGIYCLVGPGVLGLGLVKATGKRGCL